MRFNQHYAVEGTHAVFGASQYHWTNYDVEKMEQVYQNKAASWMGDRYHAWAAEAIRLGLRQQRNQKTINAYINDAIGFRMSPEVVLYYSENFFGTADTASFEKNVFRVHDLKTGTHKASFRQLEVYCSFFCLEYKLNPFDIEMIMRIYQYDEVAEQRADPKVIREIMDKTKLFDDRLNELKEVLL